MSIGEVCVALDLGTAEVLALVRRGELDVSDESVEAYIARHFPARAS